MEQCTISTASQGASERLISLARERGVIRSRDLADVDIPRVTLTRLVRSGQLMRSGRGLYYLPDADWTENHSLAEIGRRVPKGVICLLSALRFHEITTQDPWEVWIMVEARSRKPRVDYPPVRAFRASGEAFHAGVEEHVIEGVPVRVTSAAKTVADCFRFRNKVGLDVAMEALRDAVRKRRCTRDEIYQYAQVDRVQRIMRPYMEMEAFS